MATTRDSNYGSVSHGTRFVHTFDVEINPVDRFTSDVTPDTEFVIVVNGRIVKRMNVYTAERMGLLAGER